LPAILLQVWDVQTGRRTAAKAPSAEAGGRVLPQSGLRGAALRASSPALAGAHRGGLRAASGHADV